MGSAVADPLSNRPPTGATLKLSLRRLGRADVGPAASIGAWYQDDARGLRVCVAREPFEDAHGVADGKLRVHLSVSCWSRSPST